MLSRIFFHHPDMLRDKPKHSSGITTLILHISKAFLIEDIRAL